MGFIVKGFSYLCSDVIELLLIRLINYLVSILIVVLGILASDCRDALFD